MGKCSAQKGIVHIVSLFIIVLLVIGAAVWFFTSKQGLKLPQLSQISIQDKIVSLTPKPFKDVSADNENYNAIRYLARERILEADNKGNLNPESTLTRSEWVEMLVKLSGINPDKETYKDCFEDMSGHRHEAVVCFAKEQGWLEGFVSREQTLNYWKFVPTVRAQQKEATFNTDDPVKKDEAISSLSRLMDWKTDQAVTFAKERKIIEGDTRGNLTRGDAADIIYRSVATVPLKKDTYSEKLGNEVERYKLDELIDLKEKLDRQRREEASYWRSKRAKKYAEMFGEQAAAEILAEAEKFEDVFKAQEAEDNAYIRKAREKNYQQMLEEDKAFGQIPTYNILDPLQKVFAAKGGSISMDNLVILKRTPPYYDDEAITTSPVIKSRDGVTIMLFLDENYGIISADNLTKAKHTVRIGLSSFYTGGRTIGHITIIMSNFITGVDEKVASMRRFNLNNLDEVLRGSFNELEGEIGQMITLPAINSLTRQTPTPSDPKNFQSKNEMTANSYQDGYFEFLDVATGQPSIAFSTAQKPLIFVAADLGVDVRKWLPIRIEIKKDGSSFWSGKIEGDPSQVCKGPSGCSTNGPSGIGLDWRKIEITAYDKNGKVIATFLETYNPSN